MPDSRRISDRISGWVNDGLEASGEKEALFDVGLAMLDPRVGPMFTISYWFKGAILGQIILSMQPIQNPFMLDEEGVGDLVRQAVEFARQERSKQLAPQNGHGHAGSGLIKPGQ